MINKELFLSLTYILDGVDALVKQGGEAEDLAGAVLWVHYTLIDHKHQTAEDVNYRDALKLCERVDRLLRNGSFFDHEAKPIKANQLSEDIATATGVH